jgi:curved DNA-binding protein CbpA
MPGDLPHESTPYDVLEVRADASSRDIARAYRRLARAWHPDAQPVDAGAPARFQAVSDAYELLSDPARRAAYDELRAARAAGAAGSGTVGRAAGGRRRSSPPSPFRSSPPPLWPLGPATTAPLASRPHGERPGPPPVRPGPVRIEPLPGEPVAGQARAEAQLLALAEILRAFLGDDRNRPW